MRHGDSARRPQDATRRQESYWGKEAQVSIVDGEFQTRPSKARIDFSEETKSDPGLYKEIAQRPSASPSNLIFSGVPGKLLK